MTQDNPRETELKLKYPKESPYKLYEIAQGDGDIYRKLLELHGHIIIKPKSPEEQLKDKQHEDHKNLCNTRSQGELNVNKRVIEELCSIAIGAASLCWKPTPKGVFDSSQSSELVKNLVEAIFNNIGTKPNELVRLDEKELYKIVMRSNLASSCVFDAYEGDVRDLIEEICQRLGSPSKAAIPSVEEIKNWLERSEIYLEDNGPSPNMLAISFNQFLSNREKEG